MLCSSYSFDVPMEVVIRHGALSSITDLVCGQGNYSMDRWIRPRSSPIFQLLFLARVSLLRGLIHSVLV